MLIACNARFLIKNKLEGIGWFTYESLKHIVTSHPEHEFAFFFDRKFDKEFLFAPNVRGYVLNPPARHPLLWKIWFDYSVPRMLKKLNADIFISTDGFASLKTNCKQVVVMHDLAFEHFDDHVPKNVLKYYRKYSPLFSKKATRIATVSTFTKNDIAERYQISADKIDIVYNGSNKKFHPISEEEKIAVKKNFADGKNYFVYAGAIHPRKNTARLFKSFDEYKTQTSSDMKLLIAGRKAWSTDEAMKVFEAMKHKNDIVFLGHLERNELAQVMAAATALVYVSLFEGFGIPIVEAMNCDVPVITSKTSSMPEVAGNAALLVNPLSEKEIVSALRIMSEDESCRQELISVARNQRTLFSWEQTGNRLWDCIMKAVAKS